MLFLVQCSAAKDCAQARKYTSSVRHKMRFLSKHLRTSESAVSVPRAHVLDTVASVGTS